MGAALIGLAAQHADIGADHDRRRRRRARAFARRVPESRPGTFRSRTASPMRRGIREHRVPVALLIDERIRATIRAQPTCKSDLLHDSTWPQSTRLAGQCAAR